MTVSMAIVAGASAQAAIAAQQAREAKRIACEGAMPSFKNEGSTIEQQQTYAECVSFLHPSELTGPEIAVAKLLFVLALIGFVVGVYYDQNHENGDAISSVLLGICGAMLFLLGGLLVFGIFWLFS